MRHDLIPPNAYQNLPESPEDCFILLEGIAREKMAYAVKHSSAEEKNRALQAYMIAVRSLADECSLSGIDKNPNLALNERFEKFTNDVDALLVRLRLRSGRRQDPDLVHLIPVTRSKIETKISLLDQAIRGSTFPDDRKEALLKKLDELRAELTNPHASFGKVARSLAGLLVLVTTLGADGPDAAKNITSGITSILTFMGEDKQNEEEARLRLSPPQRALPAPSAPSDKNAST